MARVIINHNNYNQYIAKVPHGLLKDYDHYIEKSIPERGVELYCENTITGKIEKAVVKLIDNERYQYPWEEIWQ